MYQVSKLMQMRGHDVEIFCGSFIREVSERYNQVLTHRILVKNPEDFRTRVVARFAKRHLLLPFDIFESPEINGNGYEIKKAFPDLPMVVKIHMPAVLQLRLQQYYTPVKARLNFSLSSLMKKGKIDLGWWSRHDKNQANDIDFLIADIADVITTPSQTMKAWTVKFWQIADSRIMVVPHPFIPDSKYLDIPVESNNNRILFIGKLNVHKGLVNLAKAIPTVHNKYPCIKFRFVAADGPSHIKDLSMKAYLLDSLKDCAHHLEFMGKVPLDEIPVHLELSDFCIFPSIWECFGLVVCESMAAGRVPIISSRGGMIEIADHLKTGIMVNPHNPKQMAKAMIGLIENRAQRYSMAEDARKSILQKYNAGRIGELNESVYNSLL